MDENIREEVKEVLEDVIEVEEVLEPITEGSAETLMGGITGDN